MSSRYPMPPYPNGWFQIGVGRDLAPGEVKTIHYFGEDLVLFRTESGEVHLVEPFCPHLGAHLGLGKVKGEDIECRFHKWCFSGDGTCTHVPDARRIPPKAKLNTRTVMERNGLLLLWHDDQGRAPTYEIPELDYLATDEWTDLAVNHYKIRVHCQEIGENAVDKAHFTGLHGMDHPDNKEFEAWTDGPVFYTKQHMKMNAGPVAGIEVPVQTETVGPGIAILGVEAGPISTLSFITQTPIDEEHVDAWVNFALKKQGDPEADRMITDMYCQFLNEQYQDDIPVWESKAYVHKPALSDFDGPVPLWRKWYKQFYSVDWEAEYLDKAS